MKDRRRHLKVKIKSLAAEARIIRQEERRSRGRLRDSLALHRKGVVREEARYSQLAYGFIRGRRYEQLETSPKGVDIRRLMDLIERFGPVYDYDKQEGYKTFNDRKAEYAQLASNWI